jgi:hypothetical protein
MLGANYSGSFYLGFEYQLEQEYFGDWSDIYSGLFANEFYGEWSDTWQWTTILNYSTDHSTDTLKRKHGHQHHDADTIVHDHRYYTREQNPVLPTGAGPRAIGFTMADVGTVTYDDSTFVDQPGEKYVLFYFERYAPNNRGQIYMTWNGKSTISASTRTIYLQIYNVASGLWETLQSNNTTPENTEFTLSGSKLTSLSDYYDANNKIVVRVYQ